MEERRQSGDPLGELESAIMDLLWDRGESTVGEIRRGLRPDRELAYTTVMTVMTRLAEKGLLERRREGRAYVYSPTEPRDAVAGSILQNLIGRLYGGSTGRAIANLLESEREIAESELDRLERLISQHRRRRSGSEGAS